MERLQISPHEGKVAVGIVILNRLNIPYASDGTMTGVILHKWAFSGYWAGFTNGKYAQIAFSQVQAQALLEADFNRYIRWLMWAECERAWNDAKAWYTGKAMSFVPGPAFAHLTKKTVLYYNPKIVHTPPAWATVPNLDAVIFDENFYHDH